MTSLLNFIKIYQLVQKLLRGRHTDNMDRQKERQTGDLISLTFLFEESRLKMYVNNGLKMSEQPLVIQNGMSSEPTLGQFETLYSPADFSGNDRCPRKKYLSLQNQEE
jgi:hypothetical protein